MAHNTKKVIVNTAIKVRDKHMRLIQMSSLQAENNQVYEASHSNGKSSTDYD